MANVCRLVCHQLQTRPKFYRCYNFTPLGQCWSDGEQNNMIIPLCCFTTFASLPRSVPFLPMFSHTHSTFRSLTIHDHKGVLKVVVPIIFYQEVRPKSPFLSTFFLHSQCLQTSKHPWPQQGSQSLLSTFFLHSQCLQTSKHPRPQRGVLKVIVPIIFYRGKTQITHVLSHIHNAFRPPNIHDHKGESWK